jgi:hypothetical protein
MGSSSYLRENNAVYLVGFCATHGFIKQKKK